MKRPVEGAPGKAKKGKTSTSIFTLPTRARQFGPGIIGYRHPRRPGNVTRLIAEALEREAWVAEETGTPISVESIRDIAAWARRGCVPDQFAGFEATES